MEILTCQESDTALLADFLDSYLQVDSALVRPHVYEYRETEAVRHLFRVASSLDSMVIPICDNVVGWLGTVGVLAALRRRAVEGGSYKVVVSLTRTVLWQLALGIFDRQYAQTTAGSSEEHANVAPDLFSAETSLGTYQGLDEQTYLSKSPGAFRTVIVPRGSNRPEWLTDSNSSSHI